MPPNKEPKTLPQCNRPDGECPHGELLIRIVETQRQQGEVQRQQGESIGVIERALVGNLQTREPGLVDEIRQLQSANRAAKASRKRWIGVAFAAIVSFASAAGAWAWVRLAGGGE